MLLAVQGDMQYFVRAEFVEENITGKPFGDVMSWIETVIHPSLEALEKAVGARMVTGGVIAGVRTGVFILEALSHEEVGMYLRNLPFWGSDEMDCLPHPVVQVRCRTGQGILQTGESDDVRGG